LLPAFLFESQSVGNAFAEIERSETKHASVWWSRCSDLRDLIVGVRTGTMFCLPCQQGYEYFHSSIFTRFLKLAKQ
jgi:hypothetical protein